MMANHWRIKEYQILLYRIFLAYLFYFVVRVLFCFYNLELLKVTSIKEFFRLSYYGLAFDTTAILYLNLVFILASVLPFIKNTSQGYQKVIFYIYFIFNGIGYATNFIDFIYYKYTFARTTIVVLNVLEHENNKMKLFSGFLMHYWHVFLWFFVLLGLWIFLYKKVNLKPENIESKKKYFVISIIGFCLTIALSIAGIRGGDFSKSTRPINILDASRHVKLNSHADLVLNTPFAIIRTMFSNSFSLVKYPEVNQKYIQDTLQPVKMYINNESTKPNVVLFILESFGREYIGAFNKKSGIKSYQSHTPFLDSLAQKSYIFTQAYANGRQSIHGMSSVLSGIPSFKDAFTSSPYPKQKIESLPSVLESIGYQTSFFHGAANGSMGFLGFSNILGIDKYYGRTEYNNDTDFDGFWGIWDEPFFQFMKTTIDTQKQPFFSTVFSVSSHEPYNIPSKYQNKFKEDGVPIHKTIEYTDHAIRKFMETAKKEPWFANTIFVFVADHCNQIYYDEYQKQYNRFAVPIMFYSANGKWIGENHDLAQQIDIYPTILDMIGYKKPFRSWGRSLFDTKTKPFVMNHNGSMYQLARGKYICVFDGKKAVGFYDIEDKNLEKNLIDNRNPEMDESEKYCKAFIQDYMDRVVNKKLDK